MVEVRTDGGAGVPVIDEDAAEVGCGCHGWNAAGVWSCDGDALVARGGCCCAERGGVRDGAGSRGWWCVVAAEMVHDGGENGGGTAAAAMEMAWWRGGCTELLERRLKNAEKMVAI